jgi:hypothetical protein
MHEIQKQNYSLFINSGRNIAVFIIADFEHSQNRKLYYRECKHFNNFFVHLLSDNQNRFNKQRNIIASWIIHFTKIVFYKFTTNWF